MRRVIAMFAVFAVGALGATACTQPTSAPQPSPIANQPAPAPKQTMVPFSGLERPDDVEVDSAGNVYITDITPGEGSTSNRVIELAAGFKTQKTLPFTRSTLLATPSGD